jgi:hypothetical protein
MKETQSALGGGAAARLATLGRGLAARIRVVQSHFLLVFVSGDERDGAHVPAPVQGRLAIPP